MSFEPVRALRVITTLLSFGLLAGLARADLVWTSATGWQIEGGVLAGLTGAQGADALNLMNKARAAEERGSYHAARAAYKKVATKYSSSIYAPEAYYHTGLIFWKRHQYIRAFEAFQTVLARYPNVKRFNEIIQDMYELSATMLNGGRNRLFGVIPSFTNRERAVQYMEVILVDAPYSDYAPLCLMEVARGHQYVGQNEEAIDALDRIVNTYGSSVIAPDAYLRLAQLHSAQVEGPYYDQAETKQAITYDEDFMILFPTDPKIGRAAGSLDQMKKVLAESKMKIGDFYFYKRSNYPAARVFYNEAITSYPDSDVAKRARLRLNEVEAKANASAQGGAKKKKHFLFF
jgi:outer membrane protein assembly factor BamD